MRMFYVAAALYTVLLGCGEDAGTVAQQTDGAAEPDSNTGPTTDAAAPGRPDSAVPGPDGHDGGVGGADAGPGLSGGPSSAPSWDPASFSTVIDVGPGQALAEVEQVEWEQLGPDTLVRIHHRPQPYAAKWVLNTVASEDAPLVVLGVPGPDGARPAIEGDQATTRVELSYWNEPRSIIKVGGSNLPSDDLTPAWITIQGLQVHGAHAGNSFSNDEGGSEDYADNAASIHVEAGDHISIRDCELHGSGNGLFAGSGSSNLIVAGNHIHGNGNVGSIYEHNSYTESLGILFEYNHYGALCSGCEGNNLKDRSAGTVIRYNTIEAGNRQLDLVESDYDFIVEHPSYAATFVYGNLLIEPEDAGNSQILHYGGDGSDTAMYRGGTLFFYHNTVISTRGGNTTLLRLSTDTVSADVRNNLVHTSAGSDRLALMAGMGQVHAQGNWLTSGYRDSFSGVTGNVVEQSNLAGSDPGLSDLASGDYSLSAASDCVGAAGALASGAAGHPTTHQSAGPTSVEPRPDDGSPDIGALER